MTYYSKYHWLSGVHFHVGSQGVPLELFVQGAKICMDFVHKMEKNGTKIKTINIGGGLSSTYEYPNEHPAFTFQAYKEALNIDIPELFSGKYNVITEFGRSLLLKAGTTLSKVEYIKQWLQDIPPVVQCHVGANQFYTEVYSPQIRKHRIGLANLFGQLKAGQCRTVDIAGPLLLQVTYNTLNSWYYILYCVIYIGTKIVLIVVT